MPVRSPAAEPSIPASSTARRDENPSASRVVAASRAQPAARTTPPTDSGPHGDVSFDSDGWLARSLLPDGSSEHVPVSGPSLNIASAAGSRGSYTQTGGTLWAVAQDIGRLGTGRFSQFGGFNGASQLRLGGESGGTGSYEVVGGTLGIVPQGSDGAGAASNLGPVASGIQVGGAGRGEFLLGNADTPGTVAFSGSPVDRHQAGAPGVPPFLGSAPRPAPGSDFVVRADRRGNGVVRGWGGALGNGGALVNNGQIIADGYGVDRSLIFLGYASVTNTLDNEGARGANGWYARNNGRLTLPKISTAAGTGTYTWGENPADPTIDLVNSVRFTLHDAISAGKVDIALLDKHRADVPELPKGHTFVGVWSIDTGMSRPQGGVDLTVRYDDGLARQLGLNEGVLKIWRYADNEWVRMDHDAAFLRDSAHHILSVHTPADFTYFAVSAPEPGAVALVLVAGGALLLRRRRLNR